MSALRLALPSKGMEDDTLQFLRSCGLRVDRRNPRQYRASMHGLPTGPVEIVFQRATDVFDEVDQGTVDLGITGLDIVAEHRSEEDAVVVVHGELGYQHCALVLAVPEGWVDVASVADLADVAAELRAGGRELRVATKYANLTRQFFFDRGIRLILPSSGRDEAPRFESRLQVEKSGPAGRTLTVRFKHNHTCTIGGDPESRKDSDGAVPAVSIDWNRRTLVFSGRPARART